MPLNVEIKARWDDHDAVRAVLRAEDARFVGTDHQIDTYFHVPHGRLKLREGTIERALIHYHRPDQAGPKRSDVHLYTPNPNGDLKAVLTAALGVRVVVDKQREIYFIDNVKVHLDAVDGLGRFVEIEAIDRDGTRAADALMEQCRHYLHRFKLPDDALVSGSYAELLLARRSSSGTP
jgi:predicted adenylyl cyclase CyaB